MHVALEITRGNQDNYALLYHNKQILTYACWRAETDIQLFQVFYGLFILLNPIACIQYIISRGQTLVVMSSLVLPSSKNDWISLSMYYWTGVCYYQSYISLYTHNYIVITSNTIYSKETPNKLPCFYFNRWLKGLIGNTAEARKSMSFPVKRVIKKRDMLSRRFI